MKAVVLAGGRGKRMRPLSDTILKPMLRVGNRPILEYIIILLRDSGITDIIISVCYLSEAIIKYFGNGKKFGISITYIKEEEDNPFGTAGAVSCLRDKLRETFIVCAGDTLRELDIKQLLDFHKKKKPIATLCVYKNYNTFPKSIIHFNSRRQITLFEERPKITSSLHIWSNASFYVFDPGIFYFIPRATISDFGKDVFPAVLQTYNIMYAYKHPGYFLDIGTFEKLKKAEFDISNRKFYVTNKRH